MKPIVAVSALCLCILSVGCGSRPMASVRPLYTNDEKLVVEPRLEGEWVSKTLENASAGEAGDPWKVAAGKPGCYSVEMLSHEPDKDKPPESSSYQGCLLSLGDKLYFDSQLESRKFGPQTVKPNDLGAGIMVVHLIGRVWVQQDFIRLANLSASWMEEKTPEPQRDHGVFTGSTQELRNLLGSLPDEAALGSTWYLCRPGANCDAQIVADSLARQPDDHSVIEQAGFYFLRKRDNDRTVALFRHCVEVCQPDSGFFDPHAYLAYALLFKRDFAGARSEFTLSHKLNPDDPLDGILAITYFLEGNYAEASKLLAAARSAKAPDSPQEILLAYVCLVRLGRARQAEALLADRMEKFSGSEDEQLVLLRAVGRIKDFTPHWTTDELNQADAVLYAMVRLAKGDTDSARQALETTLQRGDKALPGFLGATIEMERLNRSSKP